MARIRIIGRYRYWNGFRTYSVKVQGTPPPGDEHKNFLQFCSPKSHSPLPSVVLLISDTPKTINIKKDTKNSINPTIAPIHNPRNQCLAITLQKKSIYINVSILNKYSKTNRENPKLCLTATFPTEKGFNMGLEVQKSKISSPKLSPMEITSPNPNIKSNLAFCLPML